MNAWDDPRVRSGMEKQLAWRRERLAAGEKSIGWKMAYGAPAIMQRLGISAPLAGFLTDRARLESGATVSLRGWTKPVAEPELAVYLGKDLPAGAGRDAAIAAIAAIGPAIELVDIERLPEPETLELTLASNISQRHVVLGPVDRGRAGAELAGLSARIFRNDAEIAKTSDLTANTDDPVELLRHLANLLAAFGEQLRAGEFIITGSVVPPLFIEDKDASFRFKLAPVGSVAVRFSRD
jgi:2-keto-4-pentenoate hydratase